MAAGQPEAEMTEQAVTAMPAWHAYRAGLKQKGYFKVALSFIYLLAECLQLLPVHVLKSTHSVFTLQPFIKSRVHHASWD